MLKRHSHSESIPVGPLRTNCLLGVRFYILEAHEAPSIHSLATSSFVLCLDLSATLHVMDPFSHFPKGGFEGECQGGLAKQQLSSAMEIL